MNSRCAWGSKSAGRGVCDQPCEGRYCARHARVAAVREAGAAHRAASAAVAEARDAVVEAALTWDAVASGPDRMILGMQTREEYHAEVDSAWAAFLDAITGVREAERAEAEARARLEALR